MIQLNQVLVAIDLSEESAQVLQKAKALAMDAKLHIVYVYEPLNQLFGGEFALDTGQLQEEFLHQTTDKLNEFAEQAGIPEQCRHVREGKPGPEIRHLAENIEADLIVVGTHSRHGLGLLLGATANSVLHGVGCDVFVVRIDT